MTDQSLNKSVTPPDMIQGYMDGMDDFRADLPKENNYSPSYVHGWLNGRDDRLGKPRDTAAVLLARAEMIIVEEHDTIG